MKRAALLLFSLAVMSIAGLAQIEPTSRHFTFQYSFVVKNVPPGEKLRLWIPLAHSDANQQVKLLSAAGDLKLSRRREPRFGNWMLYASAPHATRPEYQFKVEYDVVRQERVAVIPNPSHSSGIPKTSYQSDYPPAVRQFLQPDRLVPVTGQSAEWAAQQVAGKAGEFERARALYDFVFQTMRYDKSGAGWGRGDVAYACTAKKGNCTDFHSLFISMARSQGIPARFQIGFGLPPDKNSGEIAGYHCWSDFYLTGAGWVPVDISEAWKHPDHKNYFFGHHDVNRVEFTMGRDLQLSPRQHGEPLNYFVYPYVELDGLPYANVSNSFSFRDVAGMTAQTR